jgi:hypothetical protein
MLDDDATDCSKRNGGAGRDPLDGVEGRWRDLDDCDEDGGPVRSTTITTGTRIFRKNPGAPLEPDFLLPLEVFVRKASLYSHRILIAAPLNDVRLCEAIEASLDALTRTAPSCALLELIRVPYWGKFTPPLNILLRHATLNRDRLLLFQVSDMCYPHTHTHTHTRAHTHTQNRTHTHTHPHTHPPTHTHTHTHTHTITPSHHHTTTDIAHKTPSTHTHTHTPTPTNTHTQTHTHTRTHAHAHTHAPTHRLALDPTLITAHSTNAVCAAPVG